MERKEIEESECKHLYGPEIKIVGIELIDTGEQICNLCGEILPTK